MLRSLSVRVLLALTAGLLLGALVEASGGAGLKAALLDFEAVGQLWLNLLRMTIIPLVFCLLVTGAASLSDLAQTGKLAGRAIGLFVLLLLIAALYGSGAMTGLMALWPVDAATAAALRAGSGVAPDPSVAPSFTQWLIGLAPANPIKAAAENTLLPLVVFAAIMGLAATKLPDPRRTTMLEVFRAIADTMIVIVRWVLWAAPLGVFALALGVGLRAGINAAGGLAHYVAAMCVIVAGVTVIPYVLVAIRRARGGHIGVFRFARATAPIQALAVSTQSSLSCLPPMVERAQDDLGVSTRVTGIVLPLAVAIFRLTSPVANLSVVYFLLHVYGITPTPPQMFAAVFVALAVSFGSVGLPNQITFFANVTPIALVLGAPLELLPMLLAVEVIPDIFRTVGNVTGDMAVTALLADEGQEKDPPA